MIEKTIWFYGNDRTGGMPEPFYLYLIWASKVPQLVGIDFYQASIIPQILKGPIPPETEFFSKLSNREAMDQATNSLKRLPKLHGLQFKESERFHITKTFFVSYMEKEDKPKPGFAIAHPVLIESVTKEHVPTRLYGLLNMSQESFNAVYRIVDIKEVGEEEEP